MVKDVHCKVKKSKVLQLNLKCGSIEDYWLT